MEAITFTPAQVHVFNLVSHIKSAVGLEQLRKQLAAFYAKQVDDEMDLLWDRGQPFQCAPQDTFPSAKSRHTR